MKIAMIGQKGIPSRTGGIEIHVDEISRRLVQRGCEVNVYCRKSYCSISEQGKYNGINIKFAPYIKSKHLDAITHTFFSTMKALFSGCDIFHYHALGPSTLSFIPRLFGKKVVSTVHGLDWQRGKWGGFASKYLKFGEYASVRFAHRTISVSENLVDYFYGKYNKQIAYIPNGAEKHDKIETDIIRSKYHLDKDGYILFLARLVPEKGAHYLIDAYKQLKTDKKLVIAGGSSHSDDYEQQLHKQAGDHPNIIFTGFVTGKELEELFSNAYLYVLPSDVEGLPISLLEAMSYGNCCLTSDIPENAQVIGDMGYLFKKSDVNDLSEKLQSLVDNVEMVDCKRTGAQDYIITKYNWDKAAEKTYELYESLVNKR